MSSAAFVRALMSAVIICCTIGGRVPASADALLPGVSQAESDFREALALLSGGHLREADERFRSVLQANPSHVTSILGRAQIAISDSRLADAERFVNRALVDHPDAPEAHNMAGLVLLMRNRLDAAAAELSKALRINPDYVTPRVYLAAIHRRRNDDAAAADQYRELIARAPRFSVGYLGLAEIEARRRATTAAVAVLRRWKAADPGSPEPANVLGMLYLTEKDATRALEQFDASLSIVPTYAPALRNKGHAWLLSGRTDEALAQFRVATRLNPGDVEAFLLLGTLLVQRGALQDALAAFRQAMTIAPDFAGGYNNTAWLLARTGGDLSEADRLASRAIELQPDYADAYGTRGWIRVLRGDADGAIRDLMRARSLAGERAETSLHLAMAYEKKGLRTQALDELTKLGTLQPSPADAAAARKLAATLHAGPE